MDDEGGWGVDCAGSGKGCAQLYSTTCCGCIYVGMRNCVNKLRKMHFVIYVSRKTTCIELYLQMRDKKRLISRFILWERELGLDFVASVEGQLTVVRRL